MKILTDNLRNNMLNKKASDNLKFRNKLGLYEQEQINKDKNRPAQAISFSGSAVSAVHTGSEKLLHRVINFVSDNEEAYKAIYSLIIAGMLKPMCVLRMPGSEEKDKQIVATKNFIQAFIGFFLGFTIGGGLVKKSIDVTKNNLKLIVADKEGTGFTITSDEKSIEKIAINSLKKEKSNFKTKYRYLKDQEGEGGLNTVWKALTKKAVVAEKCPENFNPDKEIFINITKEGDIKQKVSQLKQTANEHLKVFNRPKAVEFVKRLRYDENDKTLAKQKSELIDLVNSNAKNSIVKEKYNNLVNTVLDNCMYGKKEEISNKVKETEALLNKENVTSALDNLFEFIKDKKAKETLMDTYETVWKQSTGWITAISKAKISSILLPTVLAALFMQRNAKKAQEAEAKNGIALTNSSSFKEEQGKYKALFNTTKKSQPSFTGGMDKIINSLALGVEQISTSDFGQKAVNTMHKLPRPFNKTAARMGDIESAIITGYWVQNTARSKKIDPEQKLGLNIHTVLVTLVSSATAFIIDTLLDPVLHKLENNYKDTIIDSTKKAIDSGDPEKTLKEGCKNLLDNNKVVEKISTTLKENAGEFFDENGKLIDDSNLTKTVNELTQTYSKKMNKFKSLTVFIAVVRFLIPVLMVPISGRLKKMVKEKKQKKEAEKQPEIKK